MVTAMGRDIFISYQNEDRDVANRVCAALEQSQVSCWIAPRDIVPGQEWGAGIVDGIQGCHTFVLILSGNCRRSRQIARELELADSRALRIVALRIEDIQPPAELLFFLGNVQWLDALNGQLESGLARLVETVQSDGSTRIDPRVHDLISASSAPPPRSATRWRMFTQLSIKIAAGVLLVAGIGAGGYLKGRRSQAYDRYQAGEKLFQAGNLKDALYEYSAAIHADKKFYGAYCERARIYQAKGDRKRAIADLQTAIDLYPQRAFARKLRDDFTRGAEVFWPPVDSSGVTLENQTTVGAPKPEAIR
jgi:tetratricopeptide (TPR) repeat protein